MEKINYKTELEGINKRMSIHNEAKEYLSKIENETMEERVLQSSYDYAKITGDENNIKLALDNLTNQRNKVINMWDNYQYKFINQLY